MAVLECNLICLILLCLYRILSLKSIVACQFGLQIRSVPPWTKWIDMIWYLGNRPWNIFRDPQGTVSKNNGETSFVQFSLDHFFAGVFDYLCYATDI